MLAQVDMWQSMYVMFLYVVKSEIKLNGKCRIDKE